MTTDSTRHRAESSMGRLARKRWVPIAAAATAAALTAGAIATAGGGSAAAVTAAPQAQSVGNFLDATLGGNTLDAVAKLKYATAKAPGSTSVQNPLDVELLSALDLPLTGALQLPSLLGIHLGAVTQKAQANVDGSSYGQAGAALNAGGVSVGGNNSTDQAGNATIDLSAAGIAGNSPIPIPGGTGSADALGGVKVTLGGVSSVASTPKGFAGKSATAYQIANLKIVIGSPLLGQTLGGILSSVTGLLQQAASATGAVTSSLTGCDLTSGAVPKTLSLEGGAVVIDPATAGITIDLEALLKQLGLDLNNLKPNTDLIDYLLAYLVSPDGLAKGVQSLVDGLVNPLVAEYTKCEATVSAIPIVGPLLTQVLNTLISGKATIESTISGLAGSVGSAAGANPLAPLASLLKSLLDIGVNVQPNGPAGPTNAAYVDPFAKTPKQGTPVVKDQTIVRAIEVNVAAGAGSSLGGGLGSLPTLPGLGSLSSKAITSNAVTPKAATGSTGILSLGLANAAAGPSTAPAKTTTTSAAPPSSGAPSNSVPPTTVPTGVPAGEGTHGGSPVLPLTLLLLGLIFAGGGVTAYRMRGRLNQH